MTSFWKRLSVLLGVMIASLAFTAAPASAQATRTWVSGVGDDANPCSRTAPCKTFAGAISKTAAGGEIDCLDPGGFGSVTITKSITIECSTTVGGVLNASAYGITINAALTDTVVLRGLLVQAGAVTSPGLTGVRFLNGGVLVIEDCTIRGNFASAGHGVQFLPTGASRMVIRNTTISNNGTASDGGGILVQPSTNSGTARVNLDNVTLAANGTTGMRVDTNGNGGPGSSIVIENSHFVGSAQGITVVSPAGTTTVGMSISNSEIANNSAAGIVANGASITIRVGNSTITGNGVGIAALGGATISSYGNNRLSGNPAVGTQTNGTFTNTIPLS